MTIKYHKYAKRFKYKKNEKCNTGGVINNLQKLAISKIYSMTNTNNAILKTAT